MNPSLCVAFPGHHAANLDALQLPPGCHRACLFSIFCVSLVTSREREHGGDDPVCCWRCWEKSYSRMHGRNSPTLITSRRAGRQAKGKSRERKNRPTVTTRPPKHGPGARSVLENGPPARPLPALETREGSLAWEHQTLLNVQRKAPETLIQPASHRASVGDTGRSTRSYPETALLLSLLQQRML